MFSCVSELDVFSLTERNSSRKSGGRTTSSGAEKEAQEDVGNEEDDSVPLFYCPGKRGFYAPRQGKGSFERLNAFRNVGR